MTDATSVKVRPDAVIHTLKTWPPFFADCVSGVKTFEVRLNDRKYQVGDMLVLLEWIPDTQKWTGQAACFVVTYLVPGGQFGIASDYCVMGIKPVVVTPP